MAVTGNIGTLSITDTDLIARFPTLSNALPPAQVDWSDQIAQGAVDAQAAFRVMHKQDVDRAKALADADWERILVFFTLALITRAFTPSSEWIDESDRWRDAGMQALSEFIYQYDEDDDGEIDTEDPAEARRRAGSVVLSR